MSETLKGNLSQLKLMDILKILCNSQRTGKLALQAKTETADIYFVQGEIIHAKYGTMAGTDAIYNLIGWNDGFFTFIPNISVKNRTISEPAAAILKRCEAIDADWEEIRKSIPHTNLVFKMSTGTPSEISLNAAEWNILRHINGVHSLAEIAGKVEMPVLDVAKAFYKLYRADLIEILGEATGQEERKVGIDAGIFRVIEKELAKIIGPMAPIELEDQIVKMGESLDAFPKEKLPDLVENLSAVINDPKKLIDFQKNMLEIIKNI